MNAPSQPLPLDRTKPLGVAGRARLLVRVWVTAADVQLRLWRLPLDEVTASFGQNSGRAELPVSLLSRAVSRGLRIGGWQPRCLVRSLVLYRLLHAQGVPAELVIGLADRATSPDAHAWVEVDGRDVGPLPGRGVHVEMTRFPRAG